MEPQETPEEEKKERDEQLLKYSDEEVDWREFGEQHAVIDGIIGFRGIGKSDLNSPSCPTALCTSLSWGLLRIYINCWNYCG